jgi:hypothetical protein
MRGVGRERGSSRDLEERKRYKRERIVRQELPVVI